MQRLPPTTNNRYTLPTPVTTWVERKRFEAARRTLNHRALALIHGPAGFGKSTLAAQWLTAFADAGHPTAWLGVNEDDSNPLWFLSHLIDALHPILPSLPELRHVLEERPDDAERYVLPIVINALLESPERCVVVIDDWHLVDDARAQRILARLLTESDGQYAAIVTSRSRTGLPLSTLQVKDLVVEIDPSTLRFDQDECRRFLLDKGHTVSGPALEQLCDNTEGWVAALQLTSLSLHDASDVDRLLAGSLGRRRDIGEYLTDNVLEKLEPEIVETLLRTSVVEKFTPELVRELTGQENSAALIDEIRARDLFLQPLDAEQQWFRYHHLFASFLLQRLQRERPDLARELHLRAARWYEQQQMAADAVNQALSGGDTELAARIVESHAPRLVENSRMSTLLSLIAKVPSGALATRPKLQIDIAWAYCLLHHPVEADLALHRYEQAIQNADVTEHEAFRLDRDAMVLRACIGMYADTVPDHDDLDEAVLSQPERLNPWSVSVGANVRTFHEIYRGHSDAALELQAWARPHHDHVFGCFSEVYGACFSGLIAFRRLDMASAEHHWRRAYDLACTSSGATSHAARLAAGLLGDLHYQRAEFDRAENLFEEALTLGQEAGVVDFMLPPYESYARIHMARGNHRAAKEILDRGERTGRTLGLHRMGWRVATVRFDMDLGEPDFAPTPCDLQEHHRHALNRERMRCDLIRLGRGHPNVDARSVFETAQRIITEELAENPLAALGDRALLVGALEAEGHHDEADACVAEVIRSCHTSGICMPFHTAGRVVRQVAERILSAGTHLPAHMVRSLLDDDHATAPDSFHARFVEPSPQENDVAPIEFSDREREIISCLESGMTNRQIAESLFIGVNTVKWHLRGLYRRLGVNSREECLAKVASVNA